MSDETRRVLELLAAGKVNVEEADQLLRALSSPAPDSSASAAPRVEGSTPRYLRINVHRPGSDGRSDKDVNVRVPLSVVRSGIRVGALIPGLGDRVTARLRERGVDFDLGKVDAVAIESLLHELGQLTIDIDEGGSAKQVRISCE